MTKPVKQYDTYEHGKTFEWLRQSRFEKQQLLMPLVVNDQGMALTTLASKPPHAMGIGTNTIDFFWPIRDDGPVTESYSFITNKWTFYYRNGITNFKDEYLVTHLKEYVQPKPWCDALVSERAQQPQEADYDGSLVITAFGMSVDQKTSYHRQLLYLP